MKAAHKHMGDIVEDTTRIEAFSDAVYAIIVTLLVLELRIPLLEMATNQQLLMILKDLLPEFVAFFFSFFVIAIYWVNHHHFFHNVERTDWKLLWYNNFHLFWIATIPFTTAFIGKYYHSTVAVAVYGLDMIMAALSIMLMIRHAFFKGNLVYPGFAEKEKKAEFNRGMRGVYLYLIATALAFIHPYLAIAVFIFNPIMFLVPRILSNDQEQ